MSHSHTHRFHQALLLGLTLLLTSCGSSASGPTAQATATTQATATPAPPAPLPPNCPTVAPGTFPTGVYVSYGTTLQFLPNGEHITQLPQAIENGTATHILSCYVVSGQDFQIFEGAEVGSCNDSAQEHGDYHWAFDGNVLRFTLVKDHCQARVGVFADRDWIKQSSG